MGKILDKKLNISKSIKGRKKKNSSNVLKSCTFWWLNIFKGPKGKTMNELEKLHVLRKFSVNAEAKSA